MKTKRTKPTLRASRQGYRLHRWRHEHLAIIYCASITYSPAEILQQLPRHRPDIPQQYFAGTGRKLTTNVIRNRIDKATRQGEIDNYKKLLPMAMAEVERWKEGAANDPRK